MYRKEDVSGEIIGLKFQFRKYLSKRSTEENAVD